VTGGAGTAADGDTILLAKGRYYDNVVVGKPNLKIIVAVAGTFTDMTLAGVDWVTGGSGTPSEVD